MSGQGNKELACLPGFSWSESMCAYEVGRSISLSNLTKKWSIHLAQDSRTRKGFDYCSEGGTFAINCCLYCYKKGCPFPCCSVGLLTSSGWGQGSSPSGAASTARATPPTPAPSSALSSPSPAPTPSPSSTTSPSTSASAASSASTPLPTPTQSPFPSNPSPPRPPLTLTSLVQNRPEIKYMEKLPEFMNGTTNGLVKNETVPGPAASTTLQPTTPTSPPVHTHPYFPSFLAPRSGGRRLQTKATTPTPEPTTVATTTKAPVQQEEMPAPPDVFPGQSCLRLKQGKWFFVKGPFFALLFHDVMNPLI